MEKLTIITNLTGPPNFYSKYTVNRFFSLQDPQTKHVSQKTEFKNLSSNRREMTLELLQN